MLTRLILATVKQQVENQVDKATLQGLRYLRKTSHGNCDVLIQRF